MSSRKQKGAAHAGGQKRPANDDEEGDDSDSLGQLEAFVRLWVTECCLEILVDSSRPTLQLGALLGPLLVASKNPSARTGYLMAAACLNAMRRATGQRFEDAAVDLTFLLGLAVERQSRPFRKKSTASELEREVVATCASTVRIEMFVASAALTSLIILHFAIFGGVPQACAIALVPAFSCLVTYSRRSSRLGNAAGVTVLRVERSTVFLDDVVRMCMVAVVLSDLVGFVQAIRFGSTKFDLLPMAAGSHLFFAMPCAYTDALDTWILMDLVFAAACLFAVCFAVKRDFVMEHSNSPLIIFYVRFGYVVCVALLTFRALIFDRFTQVDIQKTARSDYPLRRATQRSLQFEFVEESSAARFKRPRRVMFAICLLCAFFRVAFPLLGSYSVNSTTG